ncbi:MAG: hypothetical protein Q8Q01_05330 [archaeon]|nr:hypothetical protein [archaeon]
MNLRDAKQEIRSLQNVQENLKEFQNSWIKPIRANTNKHLPFLQNLSDKTKTEINNHLKDLQDIIPSIHASQIINEKLHYYSRYLVDLKLTIFRDDASKSKQITNRLLNDDVLSMKNIINEVKISQTGMRMLFKKYEVVNGLLEKELSLENSLQFMELSHKKHLTTLLETSEKQRRLVHALGQEFIKLVKTQKKVKR